MIEEGASVKLSRPLSTEEKKLWTYPHAGLVTVNEVLLAADYEEVEEDFIDGYDEHGCSVALPLDAVEVVMTARQMQQRKLPTVAEIASEIAGDLLTHHDEFELDEVDYSAKDGTFEAYGRTSDGLGLGFQVRITGVWETDLR